MDYLQKIRSSVAAQVQSVAAQVTQALPGNPIFREYTIGTQIGSAGPDLCWKVYNGIKNSTKQEVAIWVFEKKQAENWVRAKREELPEMMKRGVSQLTRLRHPRILTVERSLEESRDSFAFATEPIYACLANCFGDLDNFPSPPSYLRDFELLDIERRHGLYQIAEALAFLHNDTKTVHCNVAPSSIVINTKGAWKLGGFDFCMLNNTATPGKVSFDLPHWSQSAISTLCPDLDYMAPELAEGIRCDTFSDIFSLGVLSFATFSGGKPLLASHNSFARHRDNLKNMKESLPKLLATISDESFREDVKMCLNETPELRPDAIQFRKLAYFDHPLLKVLICLSDQRSAMDNTQKMQFYKGLPTILPQFPKRVLLQSVLPHLAAEFATTLLVPFILPNVFLIAETATPDEFATSILPSLVTVFPIQTPYQISLLLLQRTSLLLEKMPTQALKQHFLPLLYNSLTGDNTRIQELALAEVPNVVKFVDREHMRTALLPKLLRLVLESRDPAIRVHAIVCLAKLLPDHVEPWMVADQILPALPKINSKDPGVLCGVLEIYKMVHESDKFGIAKDQCARSVLPFLIATSVEPTLNVHQFGQFMQLIHKLVAKVETEQRHCLEQLSASQAEQQRITDFSMLLNSPSHASAANNSAATTTTNGTDMDLGDLAQILGSPVKSSNNGTTNVTARESAEGRTKGNLTLEEKRRMAAEKEGKINNSSSSVDPFSAPIISATETIQKMPAPIPQLFQQRPLTSDGGGTRTTTTTTMDSLLSEFLPPATTSSIGMTSSSSHPSAAAPPHLAASASFAAFPTLPQPPTASGLNPIQRRGNAAQSAPDDPFASLDPLGKKGVMNKASNQWRNNDPFGDLLS